MIEVITRPARPAPPSSLVDGVRSFALGSVTVVIGGRLLWSVWAAFCAGTLTLVLAARTVLPARFFYDSGHIQAIAQQGLALGKGDRSFIAVGELYNILGLQDSLLATNLVSWILIAVLHTLVLRRLGRRTGTPLLVVPALAVSLVLCCVFLTSYSKDAIVLAVAATALFAAPGLLGEIALVGAVALYAVCFRNYWALVLVVFILLRIADRIVPRRWMLLLVPPLALILLAVAYQLWSGAPIDNARALANAGRADSADASSMIPTYVTLPGPLGSALNAVVTLLSLLAPVPLLLHGGAYYGAVAVLFVVIWVVSIASVLQRSRRTSGDRIAMRCILLVLAFVTVQSVFEPDYGSALRHLSPLLPLVGFAVGQAVMTARAQRVRDVASSVERAARHRA